MKAISEEGIHEAARYDQIALTLYKKRRQKLVKPGSVVRLEGIFGPAKPTSCTRPYATMNTHTERSYSRLRYALSVNVPGNCFFRALAKRRRVSITPAPDARSLLFDRPHANRRLVRVVSVLKPAEFDELLTLRLPPEGLPFAIATPFHRRSDCRGLKVLHAVWALRVAIPEIDRPRLLVMQLARSGAASDGPLHSWRIVMDRGHCIISHLQRATIRFRTIEQTRNCVLDESSVGGARLQCCCQRTARATTLAPISGFFSQRTLTHCKSGEDDAADAGTNTTAAWGNFDARQLDVATTTTIFRPEAYPVHPDAVGSPVTAFEIVSRLC
ncbi:hypothetical protein ACVIHH_008341 [Bradyrhizobium sp. USDA 4518]